MHQSQELSLISSELTSKSLKENQTDKRSYWHFHIESIENSGLNQAEYCRRHNLNYSMFLYWKRKLRKPSFLSDQSASKVVQFVEVGSHHSNNSVRLSKGAPSDFFRLWVGDICIEVGNKFDCDSLSQLLGLLRSR